MNTHPAGTRLTALTEAWRACLRDYPSAEPAMVNLEPALNRISIQAGHHLALKVYGGIPFDHCADLVRLAVGEVEGVSLDEIYTLLGLLREHHTTITEVAA